MCSYGSVNHLVIVFCDLFQIPLIQKQNARKVPPLQMSKIPL